MQANKKVDKGYRRRQKGKEKKKLKREKQQNEEEEQIIKGVSSAIPSTNIGFKMLQQMGYNPGLALGKHGQGRLEPVGIEIKRSRTGLGRDDVEKEEKISKAKEMEMERNIPKKGMKVQDMMSEYGERQKQLWQSRKITDTYKKASAALAHLKEANSRRDRDEEKIQEEDVDEAGEDEEEEVTDEVLAASDARTHVPKVPASQKRVQRSLQDLQDLLIRLRVEFNYCFYCGCQYESADAMLSNCPGVEEEDH